MSSYGCKMLVNKPTRITSKTASCIDHFYTNDITSIISTMLLLSDHLPLIAHINSSNMKSKLKSHKFRCTNNFNLDLFLEDINECMRMIAPQLGKNHSSVEGDFLSLNIALKSIVDKHAPLQKATKKERGINKKPWMTNKIYNLIKSKNKLFKQYVMNPSPRTHIKYKKHRNNLNRIIQSTKANYYNKRSLENKSNPKNMWKLIHEILHQKTSHSKEEIHLKGSDGKLIDD